MSLQNRVFVSYDGQCPYQCRHCFSFEVEQHVPPRTAETITDSLQNLDFDVVYVSQKRENFVNPEEGIKLCEMIFDRYSCNIVVITRNVLDAVQQERLLKLHRRMRECGKYLFLGISVVGLKSAGFTENLSLFPTPDERIRFSKEMYHRGIPTMLLIRPLFPESIIPSDEWKNIVDQAAGNISCILSGALMVNPAILKRLGLQESDLQYLDGGESEYLDGAIASSMKFVDVRSEMRQLKEYCQNKGVPFFEHSLPAINYLIGCC